MASRNDPSKASPQAPPRGISLERSTPGRILHVARPIAVSSLSGPLASLGIAELPPMGRSVQAGTRAILGIGPSRWWLVEEDTLVAGHPRSDATAGFSIAVDIGDAWERFRIGGGNSLDLLSKGSSLDLDRRVFAGGACTLAAFAQLHTLLHRAGDGRHFDLYCGRSYALSLEEWLSEAAAEFSHEPNDRERRYDV